MACSEFGAGTILQHGANDRLANEKGYGEGKEFVNPVTDLPLLPACIRALLYYGRVILSKGQQPWQCPDFRRGVVLKTSRGRFGCAAAGGLHLDWRPESKEGVRLESQRGPRRH
jgi:hypothetical protein